MLKKFAGIALALIMCLSCAGVFPALAEAKNTNIPYAVDGGFILFDSETGTVTGFNGRIVDLVIPEEIDGVAVTRIGERAFEYCDTLKKVTMPSVTSIENYAFDYCESLEKVTAPNLANMGIYVFSPCDALSEIEVGNENEYFVSEHGVLFNKDKTELIIYPAGKKNLTYRIPTGVKRIATSAFFGCNALESVEMPGVTNIDEDAFGYCPSIKSVDMPDVESIGDDAFRYSSLKSAKMPNVTKIGAFAFYECGSLAEIELSKVKYIGDHSFYGCGSISDIQLPEGVEEIGYAAFCNTAYSNDESNWDTGALYIGKYLVDIKLQNEKFTLRSDTALITDKLFGYAILSEIEVPEDNENYSSVDGVLFNKDKTTLISYPTGKTQSAYKTPQSVTRIENTAFSGRTSLEKAELPNVTCIGENAFDDCYNLKTAIMPNVTEIGMSAFSGCSRLQSAYMPRVMKIGKWAFYDCDSLKSIFLPKSLTEVDRRAFTNKSITFDEPITGNPGLSEVYYEGSKSDMENILIGDDNQLLINAAWHCDSEGAPEGTEGDRAIKVEVNGALLRLDGEAIIENGRTLVPMRAIFEALGAEVGWSQETLTATGEKDGVKISVTIGSDKMNVNGEEKTLDCPAKMVNDRTLVPLRAIAEAFGANVEWDDAARKAIIK